MNDCDMLAVQNFLNWQYIAIKLKYQMCASFTKVEVEGNKLI